MDTPIFTTSYYSSPETYYIKPTYVFIPNTDQNFFIKKYNDLGIQWDPIEYLGHCTFLRQALYVDLMMAA
jgi:hypothetical protein